MRTIRKRLIELEALIDARLGEMDRKIKKTGDEVESLARRSTNPPSFLDPVRRGY